jgi:HAD superfamily hydrolase (TIGR01509 family)
MRWCSRSATLRPTFTGQMFRAAVFDFDGVICDTEWPEFEATRRAFAEQGVALTVDDWAHTIGHSWDAVWVDLRARHGHLDLDALRGARKAIHRELIAEQPVLPGVVDLLDEADSLGIALLVASNSDHAWVDGNLRRLGLRDRFRSLHTIDTVTRGKPAPDPYLAACAAVGADPRRSIAIEDSSTGVASAVAAGLFTIAVPHDLTASHDVSAADLVVSTLVGLSLSSLLA